MVSYTCKANVGQITDVECELKRGERERAEQSGVILEIPPQLFYIQNVLVFG
jgi:hypothetical protein